MATLQSTDIWVGLVKDICCSQQAKNTKNGTEKTCYDCQFSTVCDMNFDDILLCKQHNVYVSIDAPYCSKFIEERTDNNVAESNV